VFEAKIAVTGASRSSGPERRLHRHILEHRLDDEFDIGGEPEIGRRRDPGEDRVALLACQATLVDRSPEVAADPLASGPGTGQIRLVKGDPSARRRKDLGDAVTHESGAGDENAVGRHRLGPSCVPTRAARSVSAAA